MNETDLASFVTRIRNALGCSKDLAGEYAMAIGDTPEVVNGKILVRNENGRIVAYVPESTWE